MKTQLIHITIKRCVLAIKCYQTMLFAKQEKELKDSSL